MDSLSRRLAWCVAAVSLAGCGPSADTAPSSAAGAVEIGASLWSGLKPGSYAAKGALLTVTSGYAGQLVAAIHADELERGVRSSTAGGGIDVSLGGTVSINSECRDTLDVDGDSVVLHANRGDPSHEQAKCEADHPGVACHPPIDATWCLGQTYTFHRMTPATIAASYACTDSDLAHMTVTLHTVSDAGANVDFTDEAGTQHVLGVFTVPATKLDLPVADRGGKVVHEHVSFIRDDTFEWVHAGSAGFRCVRTR